MGASKQLMQKAEDATVSVQALHIPRDTHLQRLTTTLEAINLQHHTIMIIVINYDVSVSFLANVNSLYAVARPSVVCRLSSVCLSVGNTRAPYSGGSNFRQYFYGIWYPSHPLTSTENFTEIVSGNPSAGGVKHKRGSKI